MLNSYVKICSRVLLHATAFVGKMCKKNFNNYIQFVCSLYVVYMQFTCSFENLSKLHVVFIKVFKTAYKLHTNCVQTAQKVHRKMSRKSTNAHQKYTHIFNFVISMLYSGHADAALVSSLDSGYIYL